ncbi:Chlorophyll binding protein [Ectocarpus siliculosus]|uniref:Chlorophyll binding protein n=1 Tax=Ectocarpus siliculosus TaxID=2880 RepID=D7FKU4_ECTSI|nr:Chlorophyll binding protein [Ectocarpus siliculosus]|eukprot:CBJ29489.1 Chlorophyll binding protein [Ectocarpus siliculosus]
MKCTIAMLAACAAGANAFVAPSAFNGAAVATRAQSSSAMKMSFENELGAQPPLGFWDPLYWLEDADQERFDRLRYVEIKHGRICMLAILGHITQENVRLPGNLNFETPFADMPNGLTAISKMGPFGVAQIVAFIGFLELFVMKQKEGSFPGDMSRINPFEKQWESFDEETKLRKRAIELNNGRAAQMGIFALVIHEILDGEPYIINKIVGDTIGNVFTF